MEIKGLRVNVTETKVMISDVSQGPTSTSDKHPCGVCCKGVGFNSIIYNYCAHCVHKRCSGVSDRQLRQCGQFQMQNLPEPTCYK